MSDLTALALNAAHGLPVAELHGAVCGLAVCHGEELPLHDLVALVGVDALHDQVAVEAFVAAAVTDLQADDMRFAPLLPEDDTALEDRVEALGQWCSSFLAGFAAGLARRGAGSLDDCPGEVKEIVQDFAAIAQVDPSEPAAESSAAPGQRQEAAEVDFTQLQEFVKVGTLLISSTFSSTGSSAWAEHDEEPDDDGEYPAE